MPIPNIINLGSLYGKTLIANVTSSKQTVFLNNTSTTNATVKINSIFAVAGQSASNAILTIECYTVSTNTTANMFYRYLVRSNTLTTIATRKEALYLNEGDRLIASANADCNLFISYELLTSDFFIVDRNTNVAAITNIVNCSNVISNQNAFLLSGTGNLIFNNAFTRPNVLYKINTLAFRNTGPSPLDLGVYYYSNVSNTTSLFYGNAITGNSIVNLITQDKYIYLEQGDRLSYIFPVVAESEYSNVVLLLKGDGTEGSTTITDNSQFNRTITVPGGGTKANISTSVRKFGTGSIRIHGADGLSNIYSAGSIIIPAAPNGAFTLEAWVYLLTAGRHCLLGDPNGNAYSTGWGAGIWDTNGPYGGDSVTKGLCWILSPINGYGGNMVYSGQYPNLNQWTHIAITRTAAGVWSFFMDGIKGTTYNTNSETHPFSQFPVNNGPTGSLTIPLRVGEFNGIVTGGNSSSMPAGFNGFIDDYRITIGSVRYTSNFTPPVATIATSSTLSNDNSLGLTIEYNTIVEGDLYA